MIKKIIILVCLLVLIIAGIDFYIRKTYHIDERAIINTIKPPSEDITKLLPQGADLDKPLTISGDFRLAVFSDLSSVGSPRVLAEDPNGVLITSLTSAGKIIALPDKDNNGIADTVVTIADRLDRPHGIAFNQGNIYIAETGKVSRYNYNPNDFSISEGEVLFNLPGGGRHFTRTIKIHGDKLYTSVGSSCDVCVEKESYRASILVSNLDGSNLTIFANGLRNTVFFTFDSKGRMWGNDMGRDYLGDNLPPDELNIINEGGNYGWPWCYGDRSADSSFFDKNPQSFSYCNETQAVAFSYPAHVAPLGITFINSSLFNSENQGDILSSFHGSWNSSTPVGYKIVKLKVVNGKVTSMEDFISGWLTEKGGVIGRPVDLLFSKDGVLYISDDKANLIYILTKPTDGN